MAGSSTAYDVFLNHRGPDTKEKFVIPLQSKLQQKGIQSFVDKESIHLGENVFTKIDDAINMAHMHIAIFSKTYAQSTFCLNELYEMIRSGKPIVPVFYDVKPEHVRWPRRQDGPYEKSLKKHDARQKPEVVERWERVLERAANIRGLVGHDYR